MTTNHCQIALQMAQKGLPVFPLSPRNKRPVLRKPEGGKGGFHQATTDQNQLRQWWAQHPTAMVGLRTGRCSFFVIDVDTAQGGLELEKLEEELGELPNTLSIKTPRGWHIYFKWDERLANASIDAGGLGPGVDWRGEGGYVVAPGSMGATGSWEAINKVTPLKLPDAWIKRILAVRRKSAVEARNFTKEILDAMEGIGQWPILSEGQRNDTLCSVAGHLRNRNMGPEEILASLSTANQACCSPLLNQQELQTISQSIGTRNVTGANVFSRFTYVVGLERFVDMDDPTQRFSKSQLADLYKQDGGFGKRCVNAAPENRLVESITFEPGLEFIVERKLNVWRSSGITSEEGDVGQFLCHSEYLIPEDRERAHVLNFLGHIVQKPREKVLHALLLYGMQGIGKSYLARVLELTLGQHNVRVIGMPELSSSFNAWVEGVQVVRVEEVMMLGRRELMNKLKPLITESTITINQKGLPTYTIPNRVNLLFFSNHYDALRLDADDRRYCVIHCPGERQSNDYYQQLFRWTDNNAPALLHYLQNRDLSGFNARGLPIRTTARAEMVEASQDPLTAMIEARVDALEHPFECDLVVTAHIVEALAADRAFSGLKVNINTVGSALRTISPGCNGQIRMPNGTRPMMRAIRNPELWGSRPSSAWAQAYRRP
ncbi:MAG: bifunctional DNA primase/polymerase [Nitrospiraceae bacterium]